MKLILTIGMIIFWGGAVAMMFFYEEVEDWFEKRKERKQAKCKEKIVKKLEKEKSKKEAKIQKFINKQNRLAKKESDQIIKLWKQQDKNARKIRNIELKIQDKVSLQAYKNRKEQEYENQFELYKKEKQEEIDSLNRNISNNKAQKDLILEDINNQNKKISKLNSRIRRLKLKNQETSEKEIETNEQIIVELDKNK